MKQVLAPDQKIVVVFIAVFFIWFFVWALVQIKILMDFGLPLSRALPDAALSNSLLLSACFLVINNMRFYLPKQEKYWYVFVVSLALSAVCLLLLRVGLWMLFKSDTAYMHSLSQTSYIRYVLAFLMIGCCTAISLFWYTQKEQQKEIKHQTDLEQLSREAELNKLRQQLQPHFLFNSLNSISALTAVDPEKARHMIQQLADFLRGTLKKESQQWTTFEEEITYLTLYLDIEKVRFGYRLQTSMQCEEDSVLKLELPGMLLQPIVENAIKFGLYDTLGEVTIYIVAKKINNLLQVSVQNPFDDTAPNRIAGTGFGLTSVKRRLYLLFGRHDLLQIKNENNLFITTISIPQQHESNNN